MQMKVGMIGLGLIGGSIAQAIRQYEPTANIVAFDLNKEALAQATRDSVIDVAATQVDDNFKDCDYIFLCAPVSVNSAYIPKLVPYVHPDLILTDVGSVKTDIHRAVSEAHLEACFIGGHPMTGSEKSGYAFAKPMLLENAYYILTPTEEVPRDKVDRYQNLVSELKALPVTLSCEEHDYIAGTISHLPHLIAASLVNFVKETDTKEEYMKNLAAGGFKDLTRIASSSPTMWQHICETNQANISKILGDYIEALTRTKDLIDAGDGAGIYDLFENARDYRDSIPEASSGPIQKAFAIYCDIIDEAGGIAAIATILASNNINIKNIGIVHNREFEEGVLRIEFYDETASREAAALLEKYRYIVYER